MTERPILFSGPMVRALLDGSKTQTRRVVKTESIMGNEAFLAARNGKTHAHVYLMHRDFDVKNMVDHCPYGQPSDPLWVRESFRYGEEFDTWKPSDMPVNIGLWFEASGTAPSWMGKIRPSIHMPRAASRITLEITSVRVERLQDISEADCVAEGCAGGHGAIPGYGYATTPLEHYHWLWNSINGPGSWEANPWVWVVGFEVVKP